MFTTPKDNTCHLKFGNRKIGNIKITDRHILINTINKLTQYMKDLKYYEAPQSGPNDPGIKMVFLTKTGKLIIFSRNGSLFATEERNGKRKTGKITGENFDIVSEAPLEELLFHVSEDLIKEVRDNMDAWLDATCAPGEDESEFYKTQRRQLFRENFERMLDQLEFYTNQAESECRVPDKLRQYFACRHLLSGFGNL